MKTVPCQWEEGKEQFSRFYMAMFILKWAWEHSLIFLVFSDGTFTTGRVFELTIFLAEPLDGNNNVVSLAAGIVNKEDKIVPQLSFSINKNYLYKNDAAILNMIAANAWKGVIHRDIIDKRYYTLQVRSSRTEQCMHLQIIRIVPQFLL